MYSGRERRLYSSAMAGLASWEEAEDRVVMAVAELPAIDLWDRMALPFKCDGVKADVVEVAAYVKAAIDAARTLILLCLLVVLNLSSALFDDEMGLLKPKGSCCSYLQ
mmetsp:Transcript_17909/g.27985  ORF Transcript_17909/g.27985 Transcript_17909/m.27985 type:complete len:108 (+) Transcript_17909:431-754(+)